MAISAGPDIVEDGLVLCLDAANDRSYPGTGTTWTDLAGNNNGTLTNGPTFDSANGGSIVFDGSDDRVSIPLASLPTPQNSTNLTYEAVVKFDTIDGNFKTIFSQNDGTGTGRILLAASRTADRACTVVTGTQIQYSISDLAANTVFTMTLGISGTNIYLGLNGVLQLVNTNSFSYTGNGEINIGTSSSGAGHFLDGNVFAARVYNRFLSTDELRQNHEATVGRYS